MQLTGAIESFIELVRSTPRLQEPRAYALAMSEKLKAWEQRYPEQMQRAEQQMDLHLQAQQRLMREAAAEPRPHIRAALIEQAAEEARLKAESPLYALMLLFEELAPREQQQAPQQQPWAFLQSLGRLVGRS